MDERDQNYYISVVREFLARLPMVSGGETLSFEEFQAIVWMIYDIWRMIDYQKNKEIAELKATIEKLKNNGGFYYET